MIRLSRATEAMTAGVLPTLAALFTIAVMLIEARQVDWAADCKVPGLCTQVVEKVAPIPVLGLLPLFVFAVMHILGSRHAAGGVVSLGSRIVRATAYGVASAYPFLGWYMIYAGLAAGFVAAATIIGMPVMWVAGIVGAGFTAGAVLAIASGPSFRTTTAAVWRQRIKRYGFATAVAAPLYTGGYLLSLELLVGGSSWLTTAAVLFTTASACCVVWMWGMAGQSVAKTPLRGSLTVLAAGVALLTITVEVMAYRGATVFARSGGWFAPFANYIRDYKPPLSTQLALAGQPYLGARSAILERGSTGKTRMVHEVLDAGTPQHRTVSRTVTDWVPMWRLASPAPDRKAIYIVDDAGGEDTTLMCRQETADREICVTPGWPKLLPGAVEQKRRVAIGEDAFEFAATLPDTARGFRHDAKSLSDGNVPPSQWRHVYCRLNLVNVTPARLSVHQVIPCDSDWMADARRLRSHVEQLFQTPDKVK